MMSTHRTQISIKRCILELARNYEKRIDVSKAMIHLAVGIHLAKDRSQINILKRTLRRRRNHPCQCHLLMEITIFWVLQRRAGGLDGFGTCSIMESLSSFFPQ
jgi:hypothetical protein